MMVSDNYAKFKNDEGVPEIRIGVKESSSARALPRPKTTRMCTQTSVPRTRSSAPIAPRSSALIPGLGHAASIRRTACF